VENFWKPQLLFCVAHLFPRIQPVQKYPGLNLGGRGGGGLRGCGRSESVAGAAAATTARDAGVAWAFVAAVSSAAVASWRRWLPPRVRRARIRTDSETSGLNNPI